MKIITVLGARPQFVKAAVVSRTILEKNQNTNSSINEIIVHTGQHYDANMSEVFFVEMNIPRPKYNLGIGGVQHGAMTGQMLEKLEQLLLQEKPDWVLVYGDTNSTLAGALAAAKLHIPIAHIEAGLRSYNKKMPEEINRVLTDHISDLLFVPCENAVKILLQEGINKDYVHNVGDVMYDSLLYYTQKIDKATEDKFFNDLRIDREQCYVLCTLHRSENTDNPSRITAILNSLEQLAQDVPVILPIHPRTRKKIAEIGYSFKKIQLLEPVGYFDMLSLLKNCWSVITDSGGLQKEAFFLKKPCFTLRKETEWVELIELGVNKLIEPEELLYSAMANFAKDKRTFMLAPYGDGCAGQRIVNKLSF